MKKQLLLIFMLILATSGLMANDYYVATTGNDSNNGSLSTPFETLQKAVNTASSGNDIIYLRAGTYLQSTTINAKNGITITNYSGESVYIQGNGSSYTTLIEIKNSSNITVSNITFQGLGVNWAKGILVDVAPCSNITIAGNIFNNISYTGGSFNAGDTGGSSDGSTGANPIQIVGDNASSAITNVTINNNQVYNCMTAWSEAISVKGNVNGFTISNNIVHDNTNIGIDVYGYGSFPAITTNNQPQNGTINNNDVYKCICHYTDCGPLYVDGAKNITIINNKVHDNVYGISVGCENQQGVSGATASGINILDNFIYNNSLAGLEIGTSDQVSGHGQTANCFISGNTFLKNSTSDSWGSEVVMQYSTGLTFKNNIFYGLYPVLFTYGWGASNITFDYNSYYYVSGSQASAVISYQSNSTTWASTDLATFQSWVGGDSHSIFGNPSLISDVPSNGNFHLNSGSPCINAGDPSYSSPISGETDMDNEARVQNGRIDMGCDETGGSGGTVSVTGVTVSPTSASIATISTQQLTATISPSNATNQNVSWSSSNTSVATVNSSGLVTAVAAGSATITVTTADGGKTATSAITVTASTSGSYEAESSANTLSGGAVVSNVSSASGGQVVGYIGGGSGTLQFNDINLPAGTYTLTISYISGEARDAQLTVDGGTAFTTSFPNTGSWTTVGTVTTTVTLSSSSNTILFSGVGSTWAPDIDKISLEESSSVSVTGVSVSPTSASISVGGTQQLTATVSPSDATNKTVSWGSSNTSVATVNSSGLVTGVAAGSATITATTADGGKTATSAITVTSSGVTITIDGSLSDWSSINAIATATGQTCTSLKVYDDATYLYFAISGSGMNPHYHISLNTDNNTATGYNDWYFTSSGADFIIEDGTLMQFTGTTWPGTTLSTTVTSSKSSTVTEVKVPRSALGTLSSTIQVAYTDIDANWNPVAKLGYAPYTLLKSAKITDNTVTSEPAEFKIYPNPASEVLNIRLGNNQDIADIEVFTTDGRLVYRKQTTKAIETIAISKLKTKGIVFVKIKKDNQLHIFKIIIE